MKGSHWGYTGNDENLYAWRDRVSVICATTTPRTTARYHRQHRARCLLSLWLCCALPGKLYALCHGCGNPYALAPLSVTHRDSQYAFICDSRSITCTVVCAL